jgi:hypothetical protein
VKSIRPGVIIPQLSTIKDTMKIRWNEFTKSSSINYLGLMKEPIDIASLRPSDQLLVKDKSCSSLPIVAIHAAVADLQLNTPESSFTPNTNTSKYGASNSSGISTNGVLCRFTCFNDRKNKHEIIGEAILGNKMKWLNEDLLLNIHCKEDISITIEITLYRVEYQSSMITSAMQSTSQSPSASGFSSSSSLVSSMNNVNLMGQCNLILPCNQLQQGIPMNFQLPIRDLNGFRIAMLTISLQSTSTSGSSSSSSSSSSNNNKIDSQHSKKYLSIQFLEGNISNSVVVGNVVNQDLLQHKDIYFESQILFQNQFQDILKNIHEDEYISRTGYLTTSNIDKWEVSSRISIPETIINLLEKSNDTDSLSLCVLCKDAGSLSCIELGKARISLPMSIFKFTEKKFEQWITFHRYNHNNNTEQVFVGRVKMRISLQVQPLSNFPTLDASAGIGMIACRLIGVNSSNSGNVDHYNEKVITAKLSSILIPPQESTAVTDMLMNDQDLKNLEVDTR